MIAPSIVVRRECRGVVGDKGNDNDALQLFRHAVNDRFEFGQMIVHLAIVDDGIDGKQTLWLHLHKPI